MDTLYEAIPGIQLGVQAAGWPETPWAPLQVSMVQSLVRRKHVKLPKFKLIIIDEAHHARAAKHGKPCLVGWPNAKLVGLTATPQRLDNKGLGEHFAEMVLGPTIPELVDMGWLAPTRVLRIPSNLSMEGVRKDRHGEYRQEDLGERVTDSVVGDAVQAYLRYAKGKRAIFFGIHRDHSRRVCAGLRDQGIRAEHVDGDDPPARRDRVMGLFKTGGLDVVGNVNLISEGFDAPTCEVVIDGAPTTSVTQYLQRNGRHRRPDANNPNKVALSLDTAGNSHNLGLPDDVRKWSLEDGEIRDEAISNPKPRECTRCATMFWGRTCPHCAYSEPLMKVAEVDTELEEAHSKTRKPPSGRQADLMRELAQAYASPNPKEAVIAVGARRGYKSGWAYHILRIKGLAS